MSYSLITSQSLGSHVSMFLSVLMVGISKQLQNVGQGNISVLLKSDHCLNTLVGYLMLTSTVTLWYWYSGSHHNVL